MTPARLHRALGAFLSGILLVLGASSCIDQSESARDSKKDGSDTQADNGGTEDPDDTRAVPPAAVSGAYLVCEQPLTVPAHDDEESIYIGCNAFGRDDERLTFDPTAQTWTLREKSDDEKVEAQRVLDIASVDPDLELHCLWLVKKDALRSGVYAQVQVRTTDERTVTVKSKTLLEID